MLQSSKVYYIYLFREKESQKVIYVGSSARPMERIKEHIQVSEGRKESNQAIYKYMKSNNLELIKDVEIVWVERVGDKEEALKLEADYFYRYKETVLNDRPSEDRNGEYNPKRRKVKCLNDGKIFNTVTECALYYGKGRTTINNILKGYDNKRYTIINNEKYYFEYVNGTCND